MAAAKKEAKKAPPKKPDGKPLVLRYRGQRQTNGDKLTHLFTLGKEELCFKRKFKGLYFRVGDDVHVIETGVGIYWPDRIGDHHDSADDEATEIAHTSAHRAELMQKKRAGQRDLLDAIEPLRRAYRRTSGAQKTALLVWLCNEVKK